MKNFKEFILEKRMKVRLIEGGAAVKSSSRINQDNVEETLKTIHTQLLPVLKITKDNTANLGSTGKKKSGDSSGDIDLAIDSGVLLKNNEISTANDVYDFIIKTVQPLTKEIADLRSIGLISIAWPIANIDGLQDNQFVQLDLMLVNSIEYAEWAYFSPSWEESPYKGGVLNELRFAIVKYLDYKALKQIEGEDVEWERSFFDLGKGLMKGIQSRLGKKGNPVKTVKTIDKWFFSNDIQQVSALMFGPAFKPHDLLTFEKAYEAVMSNNFIHHKNRDKILKFAANGMNKKPGW